ncbi:MAG TPA: hypothetical protein VGN56_02895 [Candidatus Paceibacterota bacterium]|jgi:hypothetical protein|nr:hypothetical protein [Candidatus Paceibacterota bacterium]
MATKKTTKKSKNKKAVLAAEIGAGVVAAGAAAAAGYYFYGDKKAKKHRQAASKWAKGMKAQAVREAKKLKKVDQKTMAAVIDSAAAAYQGVRSVDAADVRAASAELKRNWQMLQKEAGSTARRAKKAVKKAAKKTSKKGAKKAAPKKKAKKSTKKRR